LKIENGKRESSIFNLFAISMWQRCDKTYNKRIIKQKRSLNRHIFKVYIFVSAFFFVTLRTKNIQIQT